MSHKKIKTLCSINEIANPSWIWVKPFFLAKVKIKAFIFLQKGKQNRPFCFQHSRNYRKKERGAGFFIFFLFPFKVCSTLLLNFSQCRNNPAILQSFYLGDKFWRIFESCFFLLNLTPKPSEKNGLLLKLNKIFYTLFLVTFLKLWGKEISLPSFFCVRVAILLRRFWR